MRCNPTKYSLESHSFSENLYNGPHLKEIFMGLFCNSSVVCSTAHMLFRIRLNLFLLYTLKFNSPLGQDIGWPFILPFTPDQLIVNICGPKSFNFLYRRLYFKDGRY